MIGILKIAVKAICGKILKKLEKINRENIKTISFKLK